jgi:hypothetical protein
MTEEDIRPTSGGGMQGRLASLLFEPAGVDGEGYASLSALSITPLRSAAYGRSPSRLSTDEGREAEG